MTLHVAAKLAAFGLAVLTLTACVEETSTATTTPNAAEQACLAAVSRETNNGDVVLLGSQFSQAGTSVQVGVGENRAPWQCVAFSDGTTTGIQFMGSEGAA